ncbi:MAG: hypothetical protein OXH79_10760 [Boseongicola sp.]|nr:hypothetical protein [Boseongicola sp.]
MNGDGVISTGMTALAGVTVALVQRRTERAIAGSGEAPAMRGG